ncbi:hypothetical protein [Rhodococcoides corynebacterioides]|uniref:hypothetical protein n=1 Tax=Rhodococcoides corynebacterioides TaxID=53972 RepID=UPI0021C08726|nr:hypothetical protein [Rhodococcus corynebacterioides]
MPEQVEAAVELRDEPFLADRELRQLRLCFGALGRDTSLFLAEFRCVDRICVERIEHLPAILLELLQALGGRMSSDGGCRQDFVDVLQDHAPRTLHVRFLHRDRLPVTLNEVRQMIGLYRAERAAVLQALTAEAVEVFVRVAGAVARPLVGQRLTALTTEH